MKIKTILLMLLLLPVLTMAKDISTPDTDLESSFPFPDCPATPNCVSSMAKDPAKIVPPFPVKGDPFSSMELLARIIRSSRRATVTSSSEDRIVAEYRSLLGFVDDVLFALSHDGNVIHVRSASRKGSWDLGVNRRRVERIRIQYNKNGVRSPD